MNELAEALTKVKPMLNGQGRTEGALSPERIRQALPTDAPGIIDVIDSTYGYGVDRSSERWKRWQRTVFGTIGHWWVLAEGERIIGVCKAGRRSLRFGAASVASAEVSELCILPGRHLRGLGSLLLGHVLAQMRDTGVALSQLTARRLDLTDFYKRFGYVRFPTRDVELHIEDHMPLATDVQDQIRPFDPERDLSGCAELYNEFNRQFMGSLIWQEPQGGWSNQYRLVYSEDDRLLGYFYACDGFGHLAYREGHEDALQALLCRVNNIAREDGKERLIVKMPWSANVMDILKQTGMGFACRECWPRAAVNMVRLISLKSLFAQLLPELSHRLEWHGRRVSPRVVEIATREDSVQIEVVGRKICIVAGRRPNVRMEVEQDELLTAVLGVVSLDHLCSERAVPAEIRCLLGELFPRRPVTCGSEVWGPDSYDLTAHPLVDRDAQQ